MTPTQQKLLTEYKGLNKLENEYQTAKKATNTQKCQVLAALNHSGMSYRLIAAKLGVSASWVQLMVEKGRK